MQKSKILITGAGGQLGKSFAAIAQRYSDFEFVFLARADLSLDNPVELETVFKSVRPQFCINCAAYTAVDNAESERARAFHVNAQGVANLAKCCALGNTKLIHISTDYVFNGLSETPYAESDPVNPINVYGESKAEGEVLAVENNAEVIIIRTAWVFSEHGSNFVKTMIRLMNERAQLNVVSDQIGSPTYATDLAAAVMTIIGSGKWLPGIYHYSNEGKISWYDFAMAIKTFISSECVITPIATAAYPTPAKRPAYSLLNTEKIRKSYEVNIPNWKHSLAVCINRLEK